MKLNTDWRKLLQFLAFLIAVVVLFGFSLLTSTAASNDLYLPLIGRYWPAKQSPLLITEYLYNPMGEDPAPEWIEIYNRGSKSLELADYKLGDSETQGDLEGMYRFPEDTQIDPGQVIVVANRASHFIQAYGFSPNFEFINSDPAIPDMEKYRRWAGGSINLSNSGDEVLLLDQENEIVDSVSWGNSTFAFDPALSILAEGHSWERRPAELDTNHAGDWQDQPSPQPGVVDLVPPTPTATQTPTETSLPCNVADLLITEVLYDSVEFADPKGEWIEIFNVGDSDVNLGCVKIGDEETDGGGEGMLIFPPGATLEAQEVILIASRGEDFESVYGFLPDYEIYDTLGTVPDMVKYSTWATGSVNLSNSGDDVILMDAAQDLVDAVSWGNSSFAFSPSVPLAAEGSSIERRPADQDSNTANDWVEQDNPNPGEIYLVSIPDTQTPTPTRTGTISPDPTRTKTPTPTKTPTLTPPPSGSVLVINEIHADPHSNLGDANSDGVVGTFDDEFIEIVNNSPTPVDLSGWELGDAFGIRHTFPQGSNVPAGCAVLVFGGGNPSGIFGGSLVQIATDGSLGLNDHGDYVYLYDQHGNVIASYGFGGEAGDDQSITRDPDIMGVEPLVKHSTASGSNGSLFSPGTRIDGQQFSGCPG